ncbi:DUF4489 domain-containing protein [Wukongibacter baidiensis]|uniref:DUF4489 domain-containing protein n=1 Tax=Wukongibacter baidiensis TaxID=1723361 RepID=UPI003D7F99E5
MTYNNGYEEHKTCEPDKDCTKCKVKHPKPKKALLECGQGTGSRTFTSSNDSPFKLAYVTSDTTCLIEPEVLIKFSSLVKMERIGDTATVRLQYELFRICEDGEANSLGIWIFEEVNVEMTAFDQQEESFSFIFCECTNCPRCCEYFVAVTPVEITNARATVSNGRMAALSQSLCDSLKHQCKTSALKYNETELKQKHGKPKDMAIACGQGNGSVVFRRNTFTPELNLPIETAHVSIETTCLSKPKVLIEFSCTITVGGSIVTGLQFELFRVCGNGVPLSRGSWTFEGAGTSNNIVKAFDFIFCEYEVPESCCEYFVKVAPIDLNFSSNAVVVDNARIVALAQSSTDCFYGDDCKKLERKGEGIDYKPKHPKPRKILLECGQGTGSRTFTSSNDSAFQLAYVTIDTACLCKPMVNIQFSSIISVIATPNGEARLRYELFRVCGNRRAVSIGSWVLERISIGAIEKSTNIFNFTFCDCATCPGCCDYFVTVTPVGIDPFDTIVTVSNGRMAALAQEG